MNKENSISYEVNLKGILKNEKINEFFQEFLNKNFKNASKQKFKQN
jgi:hypothetical protein